jgi:hypothetical protein
MFDPYLCPYLAKNFSMKKGAPLSLPRKKLLNEGGGAEGVSPS